MIFSRFLETSFPSSALQPTPEELALLSPIERKSFRIADWMVQHFRPGAMLWKYTFITAMLWMCGSRRLRIHGLENFHGLTRRDSVILVSNHRSYFDFFIISGILFWRAPLPRARTFFPVRANFFYDHPLGPLVNWISSGMSMFPPILRDPRRAAFNRYSLERLIEELHKPGTLLGLHPEGTRSKNEDPYALLPAQHGVGKVVLETGNVPVFPVFVLGLSDDVKLELTRNWLHPNDHPIDMLFGPEIDLSDLRAGGSRAATRKRAADRCRDAIERLGEIHKREF